MKVSSWFAFLFINIYCNNNIVKTVLRYTKSTNICINAETTWFMSEDSSNACLKYSPDDKKKQQTKTKPKKNSGSKRNIWSWFWSNLYFYLYCLRCFRNAFLLIKKNLSINRRVIKQSSYKAHDLLPCKQGSYPVYVYIGSISR